ncbi:hypothetical protein HK097_003847 [Rhizophlyctis rosea]|uniref:Uncharacterized protein n=1 Tax=Rhizophlyctis rosea TaxID=64517 RepID=A0AAD5S3K9_9FUNG|nr:hypothetical protein HK097_003847 [Rhizophlyctis rosea]
MVEGVTDGVTEGGDVVVEKSVEKKLEAVVEVVERDAVAKRVLLLREVTDLCTRLESLDRQRRKIIKGEEKARRKIALQLLKLRAEEGTLRRSLDGMEGLALTMGELGTNSASSSSNSLSDYSTFGLLDDEDTIPKKQIPPATSPTSFQSTSSLISYPLPDVPRSSMETEHERATILASITKYQENQPHLLGGPSSNSRPTILPHSSTTPSAHRRILPWSSLDRSHHVEVEGQNGEGVRNNGGGRNWIWSPSKETFHALHERHGGGDVGVPLGERVPTGMPRLRRARTFAGFQRRVVRIARAGVRRVGERQGRQSSDGAGARETGGEVGSGGRRPRWLRFLLSL